MLRLFVIGIIILFPMIIAKSFLFFISEGTQAIVTEFGKPVGEPIQRAGLYFKWPFIQEIRYIDKRILNWDGLPNQIPTKDKKYIKVDTTARWRISDPLKFIQTVQNEYGAKARLDTILDGHTRDVISGHALVEAVRNSNQIIEVLDEKKKQIDAKKAQGIEIVEDELIVDVEAIKIGREQLSQIIKEQADKELAGLGIKLIDVQLRRISYEKSVEDKVYERMVSERQRIAQKIRSIGKGEKAEIEGRLAQDLNKIESRAYKESQIIKGQAQAKAAEIYAKSLKSYPEFYELVRKLEAYKKTFKPGDKFILSSDSEFFDVFK